MHEDIDAKTAAYGYFPSAQFDPYAESGGGPEPSVARLCKRPLEADRRLQLLSAAERVFSEKGFSAATMDDVASAAGMSKKTVYRLFDSKTALFRTLLEFHKPQNEHLMATPIIEGSAEEQLSGFLWYVAGVVLSPRKIALQRLVIREALIAPDLAEMFADMIIDPDPLGLVECLRRIPVRGGWTEPNLFDAAEMLLGMTFGAPHCKLMINDRFRPTDAEMRKRIGVAVRLFLKGLGLADAAE